MHNFTLRSLAILSFVSGLALWAADVWVAKPFTDWTDKDIQKIMTDSPWAKHVTVTLPGGFGGGAIAPGGAEGGASGRGGRGGGGGGGGNFDASVDGGGGAEAGGGGRGGRGGGGGPDIPNVGGAPGTDLYIRWQSAPVIQEALVRAQYGAEAGSSPEAKKRLEEQQMFYIIWIGGLPRSVEPRTEDAKKSLLAETTLTVKGKEPVVAADVVFPAPGSGSRNSDAHFLFPRKAAFSLDDKEVDFATKFGKTSVKAKFTLKNMVVNGKLGL